MKYLFLLPLLLLLGSFSFGVGNAALTGASSVQYPTGTAGASTTSKYVCGGWASSETNVQARLYKDGSEYATGVVKSGTQNGYISSSFGLTFGSGGFTSAIKLKCDWTSTQISNGADSNEMSVAVSARSSTTTPPPPNSGGTSPAPITQPPATSITPTPITGGTGTQIICSAGKIACAGDQKTLMLCSSTGKTWEFFCYCYDGCLSDVNNNGLCVITDRNASADTVFGTNASAIQSYASSQTINKLLPIVLIMGVLGGGLFASSRKN